MDPSSVCVCEGEEVLVMKVEKEPQTISGRRREGKAGGLKAVMRLLWLGEECKAGRDKSEKRSQFKFKQFWFENTK